VQYRRGLSTNPSSDYSSPSTSSSDCSPDYCADFRFTESRTTSCHYTADLRQLRPTTPEVMSDIRPPSCGAPASRCAAIGSVIVTADRDASNNEYAWVLLVVVAHNLVPTFVQRQGTPHRHHTTFWNVVRCQHEKSSVVWLWCAWSLDEGWHLWATVATVQCSQSAFLLPKQLILIRYFN